MRVEVGPVRFELILSQMVGKYFNNGYSCFYRPDKPFFLSSTAKESMGFLSSLIYNPRPQGLLFQRGCFGPPSDYQLRAMEPIVG